MAASSTGSVDGGPRLHEVRCVVTGASRGIGRAVADLFLAHGARVHGCGRGERPGDLDARIGWSRVDVSRSTDAARLRDEASEVLGGTDVLVNNAGVQVEKTVADSTDEDFDNVVGVNARGVFNCCRAFIPVMRESGGGSIINIGSISARNADPEMALYNASKAFVHGLTRSIAVDHGRDGIRCNAIAPGWIMTGMADAAFALAGDPGAAKRDALARHPVGRFGEPIDVARAALWLASPESSFATGQIFIVDGGLVSGSPLQPGLF